MTFRWGCSRRKSSKKSLGSIALAVVFGGAIVLPDYLRSYRNDLLLIGMDKGTDQHLHLILNHPDASPFG